MRERRSAGIVVALSGFGHGRVCECGSAGLQGGARERLAVGELQQHAAAAHCETALDDCLMGCHVSDEEGGGILKTRETQRKRGKSRRGTAVNGETW